MDGMLRAESQISTFGYKIDPKSYFAWERNFEKLSPLIINCSDFHIVICVILGLQDMLVNCDIKEKKNLEKR